MSRIWAHTRPMHDRQGGFRLAIGLLASALAIHAQTTPAEPPVDARAVWKPDTETLQKTRSGCASAAYPALGTCFAEQMQKAGASPEAVAFMHRLHNDAFLVKYQNTGRVSIAWTTYPFRANQNSGCLLVNGTPSLVDVDDLSRLPRDSLQSSSGWRALVAKHPKATLWPDDRSGMTGVGVQSLPGSGQRFIVNYLALDGCHACARLATIRYVFDFDATGRLLGPRFLGLRALP
ncbi:MAG TPA: hypothetical protein VH601_10120 [Bryobacteraceae bacterium]